MTTHSVKAIRRPGGETIEVDLPSTGILMSRVTLDDADILALHTTPVDLVDEIKNSIIVPTFVFTEFNGTPYTESFGLRFYVGPSWGESDWAHMITNMLSSDGRITPITPDVLVSNDITTRENSVGPMSLEANGAYTDGPGTLTVTVYYLVLPLA